MATFRDVMLDSNVREVHFQPKRTFLPHASEHGTFQCDLLFLDAYKHQNNRYTGLLTLVNVPSRFGYAVPFKNKSDTTDAFATFLEEAHRNGQDVKRLETDQGSEFLNKSFQALLKKHDIEHTTGVAGDHRFTSIVERYNGSLRNWIEQWLTKQNTNRWVDTMDQILDYYNTRKHRTLGVSPESMTREDEDDLRHQMYDATERARNEVNSIQPGDKVRILLHKKAFGKGRLRWSDNVYTIKERVPNSYTFRLEETDVPQKYSDIQLVGEGSHDIRPKAPETKALAATREHALRLGRSGLARGPREAEELIAKTPTSAAPLAQQRTPRARTAPVWQKDFEMAPTTRTSRPPREPAPVVVHAPSVVTTSEAAASEPVQTLKPPTRPVRARKPPARFNGFQM